MYKGPDGRYVLELTDALSKITVDSISGSFISEDQLKKAIGVFDQKESLEIIASVSNKIYTGNLDAQWEMLNKGLIRHKIIGLFVHQSAVEYLANIFIIKDSTIERSESLKAIDNLLGLFNIYNNSLIIGSIESRNILTIMVTLWQEQLRTQSNDLQAYGRAAYLFEANSKIVVTSNKTLDDIFQERTGMTIEQYLNIGLILFAFAFTHPKIAIADVSSDDQDFRKIIDNNLLECFLKIQSASIDELKEIDQERNSNLDPKNTKNRFNPLWIKPMVKLKQFEYIVPSITAYIQSVFNGLFWWFDDLFMSEKYGTGIPKTTFRDMFGKKIFEPYVGDVLKNIYSETSVYPEIVYGNPNKAFTDWVAIDGDDAYLFEVKAYQFPFTTLQTGDLELIAKEITKKLAQDTIVKMNNKIRDIETVPELSFLKNKNVIPVVVTYNVPLVDTSIYRSSLGPVFDEVLSQTFKTFSGYFLNISDLEYFQSVSHTTKLKDLLLTIHKNNSNCMSEVIKICKTHHLKGKTLPEKRYEEKMNYISRMIKPKA